VTWPHGIFKTFLLGFMWGLCLGARTPNLLFVSFAITELYWHLTYKFLWSHVTLTTPPFTPFWQSGVGGHEKTSFEQ